MTETRGAIETFKAESLKHSTMLKEYNREKLGLEETRQSYDEENSLLEKELQNLNASNRVAIEDLQRRHRAEITTMDGNINDLVSE